MPYAVSFLQVCCKLQCSLIINSRTSATVGTPKADVRIDFALSISSHFYSIAINRQKISDNMSLRQKYILKHCALRHMLASKNSTSIVWWRLLCPLSYSTSSYPHGHTYPPINLWYGRKTEAAEALDSKWGCAASRGCSSELYVVQWANVPFMMAIGKLTSINHHRQYYHWLAGGGDSLGRAN